VKPKPKSPLIRKVQVWIFDQRNRVLLLKLKQKRGGFWQPVTGGVEKGETSRQGALREAQEETGFEFTKRPVPTGYRFRFEGRWGPASEIVYALKLKPGQGSQPRLDPREHVDAKWVTPAQARKAVSFDSNREGLRAALQVLRLLVVLAVLVPGFTAQAAQKAKVTGEAAQSYRLPSRQSDYLDVLSGGTELWVSDDPIQDQQRAFWYKAKLPSGQTGYVEAKDIELKNLGNANLRAGIAAQVVEPEERIEKEWSMHTRLAFFGGALTYPTLGAALGGDAEFSVNLLLGQRSYLRRLIALAVSFTAVPWQTSQWILAGGPVFRIYSDTLMEPEFRIRAGYDFGLGVFAFSPAFGYRLQLGTNSRIHFTWFWDLGCWLGPGAAGTDPWVLPYALSGFGLSF
jgi:8-oxo-dGTP pyrophosphatase MutT (NUDIX family)